MANDYRRAGMNYVIVLKRTGEFVKGPFETEVEANRELYHQLRDKGWAIDIWTDEQLRIWAWCQP